VRAFTYDPGRMIDTIHAVQTPEGVDLALRVAGPVPRALAWGVDFLLQGGIAIALQIALGAFAGFGLGLYLIGLFALLWFYPVLFEVRAHGQTPGKRMMGLRVVQENGTPVGWSASVLRNFLLVADFLPLFYLAGLVAMISDASFRRLGDLAAGTLVVYADAPRARVTPIPDVTPVAPPFPLTLEEQAAVIAFAERASSLSAERVAELSEIPRSLTAGDDPRASLIAQAAWLVGRKA
jgi:uncharacterized RDD family membrane protein YckC